MKKLKRVIKPVVRMPIELLCYIGFLSFNLIPKIDLFDRGRFLILRLMGLKGRGRFTMLSPIEISPYCAQHCITIDGPSFINSNSRMAVPEGGKIVIEKNVMIGSRVQFEWMNHGRIDVSGERTPASSGVIHIKQKVWIGAGVIVFADATIGEGTIVAAGSVVTKSVEPYTLVAGVPAKF